MFNIMGEDYGFVVVFIDVVGENKNWGLREF